MPQPTDLTPADTSSTIEPELGRALRTRFDTVAEVVVEISPMDAEAQAAALAGAMPFAGRLPVAMPA